MENRPGERKLHCSEPSSEEGQHAQAHAQLRPRGDKGVELELIKVACGHHCRLFVRRGSFGQIARRVRRVRVRMRPKGANSCEFGI